MLCPNCNREIPYYSLFCSKCGIKLRENDDINNSKQNTNPVVKKRRHFPIAVAIVAPILIFIAITIFLLNYSYSPIKDFESYISNEDYISANEIYNSKIIYDSRYNEKASLIVLKAIQDITSDFNNNKISYEAAYVKLDSLSDIKLIDPLDNSGKLTLKNLNESKKKFQLAEDALKKNDFITSISFYGDVIAEDNNFSIAQEQIKNNANNYLSSLFKYCDDKLANKEYEIVLQTLSKASSLYDSNFKDIYEKISKYKDEKLKTIPWNNTITIENLKLNSSINASVTGNSSNVQFSIKNNSSKTIRSINITFIAFDKDNKVIKSVTKDALSNSPYEYNRSISQIKLLPNDVYTSSKDAYLQGESKIDYVYACVSSVLYDDGTTWNNPGFNTWKSKYIS